MQRGRLIKGIGGFYYVDVNSEIFECKPRGLFRKKNIVPVIGDYVKIDILDYENKKGVIEEIEARRNELTRPPVSNVDQVIVTFAVAQPEPHFFLLDRFLVLAESQKLKIIICFNKIDLLDEKEYREMIDLYIAISYNTILTSSVQGRGIDDLSKELKNKTTVFAGPSGVGKSTLLNHIFPDLQLKTGEVSPKTGRGRHITRHAELIGIGENSWVLDTPGFSSLAIDFIDEGDLHYYFPEFLPFIDACKFNSCRHINEPNCGVKGAVKSGGISQQRYDSYVQLIDEIGKSRRY
ncbi:MAG: ribosome small subunit-dependent GTPase A [Candidatus Alkaliphilus sp. MAG34]|nr:ribosome small subunit-dependent GTPase A [Clostridiales bacterium]